MRQTLHITPGAMRRCRRRMRMRPWREHSSPSCRHTAMPRPVVVATAAPTRPRAGNGPRPKMSSGSSTRLIPLATHSTRIATVASPAARKIALMRKSSTTDDVAAEHDHREPRRLAEDGCASAPIMRQERRALTRPGHAERHRHDDPDGDDLHRRNRGALRVLLADATGDDRRRADAQTHGHGIHDRQHRLGQSHRRHRVGAEAGDENTSTTANSDSMLISITIGMASTMTAWPTGPCVSRASIRERLRG